MNEEIAIVDRGRGPQLSTSRLTVMDVVYYLHRGYDFEFVHWANASPSRLPGWNAGSSRERTAPANASPPRLPGWNAGSSRERMTVK